MSDSRHATQRAPIRTGCGYLPLLTPASHPLRETGTTFKTVGNHQSAIVCFDGDEEISAFEEDDVRSPFSKLLSSVVELTRSDDLTIFFKNSSSLQLATLQSSSQQDVSRIPVFTLGSYNQKLKSYHSSMLF